MTRVLSVASEVAPLIKTGGLADVAGALPGALAAHGVEMRVLLPGYPAVMDALDRAGGDTAEVMAEDDLFLPGGRGRILSARAAGMELFVLDAPHLFNRPGGIYLGPDGRDWSDNPERYAALSWMAARLVTGGHWQADVVHMHDWQAGLTAAYLRQHRAYHPNDRPVGTVATVHNIAFNGPAPASRMGALRLDSAGFTPDGFEFYGQISALKAALAWSDRITTVSPTYARELMTPAFGMGFEGLMRARAADVSGILNGIDEGVWNPATDPNTPTFKTPRGKGKAKAALIAELGLDPEAAGPLCVVVSRLTEQKGLDLLAQVMPALLDHGGQLALLGSGDPGLESAFTALAAHPRVAIRLGYDEALSHRLIAGGDAILVPSRFEPCGLTQLYGLRYGTIPVVALTGGLADTVIPANAAAVAAGVATGVQFFPVTADALQDALADLCRLFYDRRGWEKMQARAMAHPVGWGPSAAAYAALYAEVSPAA